MPAASFGPAVTVSATYGAGGSVIAPRLAGELGLPFVDRLTGRGSGPAPRSEEGLCEGEEASSPAGRFLAYFARVANVGVVVAPDPLVEEDGDIRARGESPLSPVAAGEAALVLGRAGAVVLASRPRTFHLRLDGPPERRLRWAAGFEGVDPETAGHRQAEADRARTLYVKRLYHRDPSDPRLYHLVLDPTVVGLEASVRLLAAAARAFFEANP